MMNFRTRVLIVEPLPHVIEISLDCNPGAVSIHAVIALRAAPLAMKPETRNLVLGCRVAWATIHGDAAAVTTTIAIGIFMTAAAATTTTSSGKFSNKSWQVETPGSTSGSSIFYSEVQITRLSQMPIRLSQVPITRLSQVPITRLN